MIRRPKQDVMLESGSDKDWEMPAAASAVVKVAANGHARHSNPAKKTTRPVAKTNRR